MSQILAIVILSGASCISPVEGSDALKVTIAWKVPCAVVVREPVANPFKAAQETNKIAAPPVVKAATKKKSRKRRKR